MARSLSISLCAIQRDLLSRARDFLNENTVTAASFGELQEAIAARKFVWAGWCGQTACELAVKEKTGATIRNIPLERDGSGGSCVSCGQPSEGAGTRFAETIFEPRLMVRQKAQM